MPEDRVNERKFAEKTSQRGEETAERMAKENAIVAEIGRIISSTLDIEEVYERFAEEVKKLIPFDRIAIDINNLQKNTFSAVYISGIELSGYEAGNVIPMIGTPNEVVTQTKSSFAIEVEDVAWLSERFPQISIVYNAGLRSMMAVPLISKDVVIGVLFLSSKISKVYTERDLRLAENIALQIAGAIANAQLFTRHKRSEKELILANERLQYLLSSSSGVIYTSKTSGDYETTFISDNVSRMVGYEPREFIENSSFWIDHIHPDDVQRILNELPCILERDYHSYEYRFLYKDGTYRWTRDEMKLVRDKAGEPLEIVGFWLDITERKQAEEALRKSEERFKDLYDNAPSGYHEFDAEGRITRVNRTELEMLGYAAEDMLGRYVWDFIVEEVSHEAVKAKLAGTLSPGRAVERTYRRKDGTIFPVLIQDRLIRDDDGDITGIRTTIQDITERKRAEKEMINLQEQLRQSQRIEAIGRLTGGIAHDFNNLLTVIKGYSQLSLIQLKESDPLKGSIEEIQKASQRASDLTRQLLAFSRRQVLEFEVLGLNTVLRDLEKMLRRVIGEDIELVYLLPDDLGMAKTDPGQIEQVILNLVVNARDAMPSGGKLIIETANVFLDEAYTHTHIAVKPGYYVMLSVSDTGIGMSQEVKERIFEPFFTTKETGKGTGLGLSTVYGIVKQSGGHILVYSKPGQGSSFKIYLPMVEGEADLLQAREEAAVLPRGTETILLVEDEPSVRTLASRILSDHGYTVMEAANGDEALQIVRGHLGKIHLLLTDVVMPKIGGKELADHLKSLHQDIKVLFTSGYTDNAIVDQGGVDAAALFLQKPFSPETLLRKIREVLDK